MNSSSVLKGSIISAALGLAFFAFAGVASAATWYVDSSVGASGDGMSTSTAVKTISEAVVLAADGDTVLVETGTYPEDVDVSKQLTLTGTAMLAVDDPLIEGQVTISSDSVSFSGFRISNPDGSFGILINGVSNVMVTGNLIEEVGTNLASGSAQGIYLEVGADAVDSVEISGNTISAVGNTSLVKDGSSSSAKGIYVGHTGSAGAATNIVISNNEISSVEASTDDWNGGNGGRGAYGILVNNGGGTSLTIESNTISFLEGLWAHGIGLEGDTPSTTLNGNTFGTLTDHKGGNDAHNVFFQDNASMTSVSVDGSARGTTDVVAVDASWSGYEHNPLVGLDGSSYIFGVNAFGTIQEAIDAVDVGGTVRVAAGTYSDNLMIDSHVSIVGATGGGTNLEAGADAPLITLTGSGASASGPILIQNLNLQTDDTGTDLGKMTAIYIPDGADVEFVKLSDLVVTGNNRTYPGLESGIYVQMTADVSNFVIEGSTFTDLSYGLITNAGVTTHGSFDNITITDSVFDHNSSKGMYFEKLSNATFTNVEITNNGSDQNLMASWAKANGAGLDINLKYNAYANITLDNLTVTGNGLGATNGTGVAIKTRDDAPSYSSDPATLSNVSLVNSTFSNNNVDVRVGEPGKTNAGPSVMVNESSLTSTNGLVNDTTANVDATKNWWGSASSPEGVSIGGTGTSTVSFSPWYSDAGMTTLQYSTTSGTSTVTTTTTSDSSQTTSTSEGDVTMEIDSGTTITGTSTWDGTVDQPVLTQSYFMDGSAGEGATVDFAVEVGDGNNALYFSQPIKLVFEGQAGKKMGWSRDGHFEVIDATCSDTGGVNPPTLAGQDDDCVIDNGSDLIVWTRHLTAFIVYTVPVSGGSTPTPTPTTGGGGGGGGNGPIIAQALPNNGGGSTVTTPASNPTTPTTPTTGGQVLGEATFNFTSNLTIGSRGTEVTELQKFLIARGYSIPSLTSGAATYGYFGSQTRAALAAYQAANGISPAVGYFGPITRAQVNASGSVSGNAALIAQLLQQVQQLQAQLNAMIAAGQQ